MPDSLGVNNFALFDKFYLVLPLTSGAPQTIIADPSDGKTKGIVAALSKKERRANGNTVVVRLIARRFPKRVV